MNMQVSCEFPGGRKVGSVVVYFYKKNPANMNIVFQRLTSTYLKSQPNML